MFAKRSIGILLLVSGILAMSVGSVLAGFEGPVAPANEAAAPATGPTLMHQLGWVTGALGVLLALIGVVAFANPRRALF